MIRCIPIFILFLVSCQDWNFQLSPHEEKKLVVNGYFTNQIETQEFTVSWSNGFGSENPEWFDGLDLEISGPGGIYSFTAQGQGRYTSDVAFAGQEGAYYTIRFEHAGITYEALTQMPYSIAINDFEIHEAGYGYYNYPEILVSLTSAQTQYIGYKLYKLDQSALPDTVWLDEEIPFLWTMEVKSGNNLIQLYYQRDYYFNFYSKDLVRLYVYSLSKDVAEYIQDLSEFMGSETNGGKYQNPPYFYSNEAYGLGYGTVIDSAFFLLP